MVKSRAYAQVRLPGLLMTLPCLNTSNAPVARYVVQLLKGLRYPENIADQFLHQFADYLGISLDVARAAAKRLYPFAVLADAVA